MPRGAAYYNGYYPGYIRVTPNSAFWVVLDSGPVMLHIVRHERPVIVTDFSNTFRRRTRDNRLFTELDHPIQDIPEDSIVAHFRLHSGEEDSAVYTKNHDYTFYRRKTFTEITVGAEVENLKQDASRPGIFLPAIHRLVELYRVSTQDVVIRLNAQVQVIRERIVRYHEPAHGDAFQRLMDHIPKTYNPIICATQDTIHDTPVVRRTFDEMAEVLGHHLASNTQVSNAQRALVDAFERLSVARDARREILAR